ncbi:MAG: thrombospondin type 3 repeat-containing protein, partial [Pseudomonadota bacterium]
VLDPADNCIADANADQADLDQDGQGDVCDDDIDGDGMPNDYETENGLDPMNSFDQLADPDGDGFTNLEEFQFGTDPNSPDADLDNNGVPDVVDERRMQTIVPNILLPLLLD